MSEMAEIWGDLRKIRQEKKRANLSSSTAMLEQNGIRFTSNNGGIHLVLSSGSEVIDYWPSTGLWMIRGNPRKHRGVNRLIAYMKGGPK